jgi:hypothetical protein
MTKYNFFKSKGITSKRKADYEKHKDKISEEEEETIVRTAQYLGEYDENLDIEDLAKKVGWGKNVKDEFFEEETGWTKTEEGMEYSTVVTPLNQKDKKGVVYKYARIVAKNVDPKWVGRKVKIIVFEPLEPSSTS